MWAEELRTYGVQLQVNLQRAEEDKLIPDMLNQDDCGMESESSDKESICYGSGKRPPLEGGNQLPTVS